jgi:hypothetical protein
MKNITLRIVLAAGAVLGASPLPAQSQRLTDYATPPPVLKLGECVNTQISWLGSRLEAQDEQPVPGSGSAVQFADGLYQVSRKEEAPIQSSQMGDPVSICRVALPKNCPPNVQGKIYKTTNLRLKASWTLADSDHVCGA